MPTLISEARGTKMEWLLAGLTLYAGSAALCYARWTRTAVLEPEEDAMPRFRLRPATFTTAQDEWRRVA